MRGEKASLTKRLVAYGLIVCVVVGAFVGYQLYQMRQRNVEAGQRYLDMGERMEKSRR